MREDKDLVDETQEYLSKLFKGRSGLADAVAVFAVFIEDDGSATMNVAASPPERGVEMFRGIYEFLSEMKEKGIW